MWQSRPSMRRRRPLPWPEHGIGDADVASPDREPAPARRGRRVAAAQRASRAAATASRTTAAASWPSVARCNPSATGTEAPSRRRPIIRS